MKASDVYYWISNHIHATDLTALASSLFGAFFGAVCAYLFANRFEKIKTDELRYDSCIKLQLVLISHLNFLENVRMQHLNQFRDDPSRAFKLTLFLHAPSPLKVNFDSISFLLVGKHANLIQDIYLAERTYSNAVDSITARNEKLDRFYSDRDNHFLSFNPETGASIVAAHPGDIKIMTDFTDAVYQTVDNAIESIESIFIPFRNALKERYPKRKFLDYEKTG